MSNTRRVRALLEMAEETLISRKNSCLLVENLVQRLKTCASDRTLHRFGRIRTTGLWMGSGVGLCSGHVFRGERGVVLANLLESDCVVAERLIRIK